MIGTVIWSFVGQDCLANLNRFMVKESPLEGPPTVVKIFTSMSEFCVNYVKDEYFWLGRAVPLHK